MLAFERQNPNAHAREDRAPHAGVRKKLAIWRPGHWHLSKVLWTNQCFLRSAPVGGLPLDGKRAIRLRHIRNALAVRRPKWGKVCSERQPHHRSSAYVINPD